MGFNGINRCVKYSLAAGVREGRVRSRDVFIKRERSILVWILRLDMLSKFWIIQHFRQRELLLRRELLQQRQLRLLLWQRLQPRPWRQLRQLS